MHIPNLCARIVAIAAGVAATPIPSTHNALAFPSKDVQYFYLRANCPGEPWHGRHIVAMPTSHQLGLENFTVHPETPPLKFQPLKLTNGNYVLQGEGQNGNASQATYLAALKSTSGTRTASMAIINISEPTHTSKDVFGSCPEGYECHFDQWTFDDGVDNVHPKFRYVGFAGKWAPFKDAKAEGWHVYWKGDQGLYPPIQLDLAPVFDG